MRGWGAGVRSGRRKFLGVGRYELSRFRRLRVAAARGFTEIVPSCKRRTGHACARSPEHSQNSGTSEVRRCLLILGGGHWTHAPVSDQFWEIRKNKPEFPSHAGSLDAFYL